MVRTHQGAPNERDAAQGPEENLVRLATTGTGSAAMAEFVHQDHQAQERAVQEERQAASSYLKIQS